MKYVIVSIILFVLGILGFLAPIKNLVVGIFSPVQFGLAKTAFELKETFSFFTSANTVRQKNLDLLNQVQQLREQLVQQKITEDENLLLKKQLELDETSTKYDELLVEVMADPGDLGGNAIIINKGSNEGIKEKDMVVIGKYLVGTVKNVQHNKAYVTLITSPDVAITAYDISSKDKTQGLVQGSHGAGLNIERILPNETISVGDIILSSGKDGIFKANFILGEVTAVAEDPSQPLKKAVLKTLVDFSKITKVFVLRDI